MSDLSTKYLLWISLRKTNQRMTDKYYENYLNSTVDQSSRGSRIAKSRRSQFTITFWTICSLSRSEPFLYTWSSRVNTLINFHIHKKDIFMTYDYSDICFHRMKQTRMIFDQISRREISFDSVSDSVSYTRRIIDVWMYALIHHTSERNIYFIDSRRRKKLWTDTNHMSSFTYSWFMSDSYVFRWSGWRQEKWST